MRATARPTLPGSSNFIRLLAVLALVLGSVVANGGTASSSEPAPTIASDKADYAPGSTVNLTGDGWAGDTTVHITVNDTLGKTWKRDVDVAVDGNGQISDSFVLPSTFVAEYDVLATGLETGRTATTTFTDASADIDQCANGQLGDPPESCNNATPNNWVNGNLGASKSHYFEGDSIPYRIKMDGLTLTAGHKIIFAWDVSKDSKHAIDYLTDFDRTVSDANPCTSVAVCGAETTFPIPADPTITGFTQIAGSFSMFGGTITAASAYGLNPGSNNCPGGTPDFIGTDTRCIELTFTATQSNPVLAWGGHIATRQNWGPGNSAVDISGSPFHTSLVALNGSGGNQDRSLSSDAVIFPATITIKKHTAPPSSTSFGFTGSPAPVTNFSLTDNSAINDAEQTFTLDTEAEFATYTFIEGAAPGYALSSISCSVTDGTTGSSTTSLPNRRVIIVIKEGENRTCTFTNDLQTGTLTVIKHVVNDDGGGATAAGWSIHVKSGVNEVATSPQNGSEAGTVYTLNAGTYDVSETGGPGGYTFDGFTGNCNASGSVTVPAGGNVTCTLTNNDNTPQLKLVKNVTNDDGGGATGADFNLSAAAPGNPLSRNFSSQTATPIFHNVAAGASYTLSESGPAGYSSDGVWSCDGGNQVGSTIVVPLGGSVTCTITNTDDTPQLKLVKNVTNNDGGTATAANFNLTATGSSRTFSSQTASPTFHDVTAGVTYTLSETGPAGYTGGAWSCDGGTQVGATIQVPLGGQVTCSITNTDDVPQLKLVKVVDADDGGQATPASFNLSAAAAGDPLGRNFSSQTASPTFHSVSAGSVYTLSETGPAGYSASSWTCTGAGATQVGDTIAVALGGLVTCMITNTDNTPQLKLVKTVTNDDGGLAGPNDWTLSATAAAPDNGRNFSTFGGLGVFQDVFAGAAYALAENPNPGTGYSSSGQWSCPGGVMSAGNTVVTVPLGAQVTCTIVNTDDTPQLMLVKTVTNNDGGTNDADDWSLSATAAAPDDDRNFSNDGGSGVFEDIYAGVTYDLAESPNAGTGYSSNGVWVCVGGDLNPAAAQVTVALGASVTCTITNTDNTPTLRLQKLVTNNDGGTSVASDYTLSAAADAPNDGRNFSDGGASVAFHNVFAGFEYALSESPNPGTGYSTTGVWSCPGGTMNANNNAVTVPLGASVTCTITNTDNKPELRLQKIVTNNDGGTRVASDYTLSAAAGAPNDGRNFSDGGASVAFHDVFAGFEYALSESPNPGTGYSTTGVWSCNGGTMNANGNAVTVALGASVTCTITNTDNKPELRLQKIVTNNDGGTAVAADYTLSATADAPNAGRNFSDGGNSVAFHDVFAGATYALSESPNPGTGYSTTGVWSCTGGTMNANNNAVTLSLGASVTCTITNTDNTPELRLQKIVTNNDGGTAVASDYTLSATASGPDPVTRNFTDAGNSIAFHDVFAGATYALSENPNPGTGYSSTGQWSCTGGQMSAGNTAVTVALGASVTCTITNTDNTPQLKLVKSVVNDDGGAAEADDWSLSATADVPNAARNFSNDGGSGTLQSVFAGVEYTLAENPNPGTGYSSSGEWSCPGGALNAAMNAVTVPLGASVTCTIINADNTPQLKLVKSVLNNDGGTNDADDWSLSATAEAPNAGRNFNNLGGSGVLQDVFAGTAYTLAESPFAGTGYSSTGQWSCPGGTMSAGNTVVTVALGASVTCTITNSDDTPQLRLQKVVTNNDGGTAVASDYTLSATATGPDPVTRNFSDAGNSVAFHNVFANATYALSESPNPGTGYSSTGQWSCNGGQMSAGNTAVTVALGASVTCTITNTDNTPKLKLVKNVTNNDGGGAVADDWTLSAAADAPNAGRNFSNLGGSGVFQDVFAGSAYALSENPNPGTGFSSSGEWSCDGGTMSAGNTVVTVPLGAQVTCTITNTDNTPQLRLVKSVVNNDGGTKVADEWTLSAAADAPKAGRNFSDAGGSGTFQDVFAGAEYALSETPNAGTGYSTTGVWSCDGGAMNAANNAVTVPLGGQVTCTITNTDNTPRLKLVKVVDADDGGTATAVNFVLTAAAAGNPLTRNFSYAGNTDEFRNVAANAVYTLSESGPAGYTASAWSCDFGTQVGATISVPLGVDVTCTITNTDNTPRLKLVKVVDADDGGTATAVNFVLTAAAAGNPLTRNFSYAGNTDEFRNSPRMRSTRCRSRVRPGTPRAHGRVTSGRRSAPRSRCRLVWT